MRNKIQIGIKVVFWITIGIMILTYITPLNFSNSNVHITFLISLIFCYTTIMLSSSDEKIIKNKWMTGLLFIFLVIALGNFTINYFSWGNGYKTQWITHRQIKNPTIRIESQMEDIGAFGYNRRTVKIIPITPIFNWTTYFSIHKLDPTYWKKVDEYVNELNLKGG